METDLFNGGGEKLNLMHAQIETLKWIGMWKQSLTLPRLPRILAIPIVWFINIFLKVFVFHTSILFCITAVREIQKGSFNEITGALSQTLIFTFGMFSVIYFKMFQDQSEQLVEFMNTNFKKRSAIGIVHLVLLAHC